MYKLSEVDWKKIALVDMKNQQNSIFSNLLEKTILKYKSLNKKILFIVNKKGYNSSYMCLDCWWIPKCESCDIPIWKYVQNAKFIHMCPICRRVYSDILVCKKCWSTRIKEIWIGVHKFSYMLKEKFSLDSLVLENTDINSVNKIKKIKSLLLSTNIIVSTGIFTFNEFFIPDIIVFPNADTWLSIPDYNVAEKHFLFIYEFLKNYSTKNFIIQTFNPEHYVYQSLLKMDLDWFWKKELEFRKQFSYPPYTELAVLIYKNQIEDKLYAKISKIEAELRYLIQNLWYEINLYTTPQLVYKKFWKYHFNIILKGKNLKSFLDKAVEILKLQNKWFQVDWLPLNLI